MRRMHVGAGARRWGFSREWRLLTVFGGIWEESEGRDRVYSMACRLAIARRDRAVEDWGVGRAGGWSGGWGGRTRVGGGGWWWDKRCSPRRPPRQKARFGGRPSTPSSRRWAWRRWRG